MRSSDLRSSAYGRYSAGAACVSRSQVSSLAPFRHPSPPSHRATSVDNTRRPADRCRAPLILRFVPFGIQRPYDLAVLAQGTF